MSNRLVKKNTNLFRIRPKVPIAWIEKELGFESRTDCIDYLKLIKAKTIDQYVETKESLRGLKEYLTQQD